MEDAIKDKKAKKEKKEKKDKKDKKEKKSKKDKDKRKYNEIDNMNGNDEMKSEAKKALKIADIVNNQDSIDTNMKYIEHESLKLMTNDQVKKIAQTYRIF